MALVLLLSMIRSAGKLSVAPILRKPSMMLSPTD